MEDRRPFDASDDDQSIHHEDLNGENEALKATMTELTETKKELDRAREATMQSWLDSKALIDELEKLQSELTKAKNRVSMATVAISTLESQLEITNTSIRSKEEEELKAKKMIDKLSPILEEKQLQMMKLKRKTNEERRVRAKLKQELRLRRQSLRTLQLTRRAVRMESEAFEASATAAFHHIKHSKMETALVELTHEEYHTLKRKANEETALADWRVSISKEQQQLAKASKEDALRRLEVLRTENRSKTRPVLVNPIREEGEIIEIEAKKDIRSNTQKEKMAIRHIRHLTSLKDQLVHAKANENIMTNEGNPQQRVRRSRSHSNKEVIKKKSSILHQIQRFLMQHFRGFFG